MERKVQKIKEQKLAEGGGEGEVTNERMHQNIIPPPASVECWGHNGTQDPWGISLYQRV